MGYECLSWEIKNGVGELTLMRPNAGNAINNQMAKELLDVANICGESKEVRVILLRATGKLFCAGGDIKSFIQAGERLPVLIKELTTDLHGAISRFSRIDAPMVCAVQGMAAGAGMSLACGADLVFASENAAFTMAYTKVGLTPDGASSWYLPRLIGMRRSQELMLTNRKLSAAEALEWGLISKVVSAEELDAECEKVANRLANGATRAFGGVKALLRSTYQTGLETQMENETQWVKNAAKGIEGEEGLKAFIEKRKPNFRDL